MKRLINRIRRWWRTGRLEVRQNLDRYRSANDAYLWADVEVRGVKGEHAWINGKREIAITLHALLEGAARARNNQSDKPEDMQ